jgi:hypothetical protein
VDWLLLPDRGLTLRSRVDFQELEELVLDSRAVTTPTQEPIIITLTGTICDHTTAIRSRTHIVTAHCITAVELITVTIVTITPGIDRLRPVAEIHPL